MIRLYNGSVPSLHYGKCSKISNKFSGVASLKFKYTFKYRGRRTNIYKQHHRKMQRLIRVCPVYKDISHTLGNGG